MFPLKLSVSSQAINSTVFEKYKKDKQKKARRLTDEELKKRAQHTDEQKASRRQVTSTTYVRDEYVSEYAKRRANGMCQLCDNPAPFNDNEGKPYLECHHIDWLSKGGSDTINNTVALCPNCHKRMHILNEDSDKELLKQKVIY